MIGPKGGRQEEEALPEPPDLDLIDLDPNDPPDPWARDVLRDENANDTAEEFAVWVE